MTALGFLVIVAYLLAFFIYNGVYSIKNKIDNRQIFYDKKEKIVTSILAIIFIIAFFHNWTNYRINNAYSYIVNHPDEYTDYIATSFVKRKNKLYKCIENKKNTKFHELCKQQYDEMKIRNIFIDTQIQSYYEPFFEHASSYEPENMKELMIMKVSKLMEDKREK